MSKDIFPLRIAQIAPLGERVPPEAYGGTERVVSALTDELVRLGHDVSLFASGDSITSAKLYSVYPKALRGAKIHNPYGLNEWTLLNAGEAYRRQEEFDIIHDHNYMSGISMAQFAKTPTIMTIHSSFTPKNIQLLKFFDKPEIVTISKSQGSMFPDLKILSTVYNGLALENYLFSNKHDGYLLYVGRICMEKGLHLAIDVANKLNLPLIIAAKLDNADLEYFYSHIISRLDGERIKWIGEVDDQKRNELMSKAMCILHPVTWPEPFGLTMIESMATGCPVVALNQGSIPEVVRDKKTGFVVRDVEEMVEAVKKIDKIDRRVCRAYALKNFNSNIMAKKYLDVYYGLIKSQKKPISYLTNYSSL
ncbi:MAG: glycosyltransferase family 4 protein [bacterium]|nr:glycosyltransferase family 4 protein [bacterium]